MIQGVIADGVAGVPDLCQKGCLFLRSLGDDKESRVRFVTGEDFEYLGGSRFARAVVEGEVQELAIQIRQAASSS
jgi:hypothetical protein